MKLLATVLYEDKASPDASRKHFALHDLVLACVADQIPPDSPTTTTLYQLHDLIKGVPRNGRDKVLEDCRDDRWQKFSPRGQPVFAVIDHDKAHDSRGDRGLNVEKDACHTELRRAFRAKIQTSELVRLVVLRRNLESLFLVTRERELLGPEFASSLKKIIEKTGTSLIERDEVLRKLAFGERRRRDVLRTEVPSLDYLAQKLSTLVTTPT